MHEKVFFSYLNEMKLLKLIVLQINSPKIPIVANSGSFGFFFLKHGKKQKCKTIEFPISDGKKIIQTR